MLSVSDIKDVRFSGAVKGYKKEEVDVFLDKIAADYLQAERMIKEYQMKIAACEEEIKSLKSAQDSIQSVLLSAQGLADNIVNEAKQKSEEIIHNAENNIITITEKEKELSAAFEAKAQERKEALEKELTQMVNNAQLKADSINAAAADSVARQQMLFDKLKLEIAAFKSSVTAKYKEHLEILSHIPDSVPNDPQYLAKAVSAVFDNPPEPCEFVSSTAPQEDAAEAEQPALNEEKRSEGFKVEDIDS